MEARGSTLRIEPGSKLWPAGLRDIEAPPERLWIRGREELFSDVPCVAIVGTRAPTPYGEAQAARFATAFAEAGICVVSGLARGIDQAAHRAVLRARGATIAVLGSGVDRPWPGGEVAEEIARSGLLVSEFEPGEPPRPHHFPLRNRLISGLSAAIVVIEAAHASGSLITARWAADQGRTVHALPGRVDHPMSRGTHRLIREGANLVESPEEVLVDLGFSGGTPAADATIDPSTLSEAARAISSALRGDTLGAEELAVRLSIPVTRILVELVQLEMHGAVVRSAGGLYRLAARTG